MSRNPEYEFVSMDAQEILSRAIAAYETLTGMTVQPASPEMLFLRWHTAIILQERALNNYTGNQNIPSRAEGENLDALGELFLEHERPDAKSARCRVRFEISQGQPFPVLISKGTRVSDAGGVLVWETEEDALIPVGKTSVDVEVVCQTPGTAGNGYLPGQIDTIVDLYSYCTVCRNVTESEGGTDAATDEEYYHLLRLSQDGWSTAGSTGSYTYHAMQVSTGIADVVPNSPSPGEVYLYVLMKGGKPAGEEIKKAVYERCSADRVRPFTDHVQMGDPEIVPYEVDLTWYSHADSPVSAAGMQKAVEQAVQDYIDWQSAKLGRDINPSKLYQLLMQTGIKRVDLRAPSFQPLRDGRMTLGTQEYEITMTVPQVGQVQRVSVLNGGCEDE